MTEVVFLDTSVLLNILKVPRKCSDWASVVDEFKKLAGDGATLVFPLTAVIETGSVIAQLAGHDRRVCMERFSRIGCCIPSSSRRSWTAPMCRSGGSGASSALLAGVGRMPWTAVGSSARCVPG